MNTQLIHNSMTQSMSYEAFCELMQQLAKEGKTSGTEQTEARIAATRLNASRIKRLNKTLKISAAAQEVFASIEEEENWLVILESWCADGAQTIPVLHKIAECSENINLSIVWRDEQEDLMDAFLTNGTRSIPKLIVVDKSLELLYDWGPRSAAATTLVQAYKAEHGKIDAAFKEELQRWYLEDKGEAIVEELKELVKNNELSAI